MSRLLIMTAMLAVPVIALATEPRKPISEDSFGLGDSKPVVVSNVSDNFGLDSKPVTYVPTDLQTYGVQADCPNGLCPLQKTAAVSRGVVSTVANVATAPIRFVSNSTCGCNCANCDCGASSVASVSYSEPMIVSYSEPVITTTYSAPVVSYSEPVVLSSNYPIIRASPVRTFARQRAARVRNVARRLLGR